MERRTVFILVGIVLALATTGGWLAHYDARRASPHGVVKPAAASPPTHVPATTAVRDRASASMAAAGGIGRVDPGGTRCEQAWRQAVRRRIAQMAAVSDADSQLAAALLDLEPLVDPAAIEAAHLRRHRRLQWAMELAPDDPLLAAHAHRLCRWDDRCDALRTLEQLVRVDPDNTWTWVAVLARAQDAGDAAGVGRALERAASSGAARSHLGQTSLRLLEQFGAPELPDRCAARLLEGVLSGRPATDTGWIDIVIGANALQSLPEVKPLLTACPPELRDPRRRELCIRSLAHVAAGETMFEQSVAQSRLAQLTAGTSQGAAWRERYRNLLWLQAQARERHLFEKATPLDLWERGEVRTLEEKLQAMDAWPAPPGWLPEGEEYRSLVLTGRMPPRH